MEKQRVLIVDDESDCRFISKDILENNFEVEIVEASCVTDAINILQEDISFSLIICDFKMGRGTGFEVLEYLALRMNPIPVIFFSSLDPLDNVYPLNKSNAYTDLEPLIRKIWRIVC